VVEGCFAEQSVDDDKPDGASERAVVELVGERLSNAEVAERLFLSVHTVKRHLANARLKLGPASRADLARGGRPEA
jgi:DNA-binding CsgD family transcriptional regulator